jgi:hypothetical protein
MAPVPSRATNAPISEAGLDPRVDAVRTDLADAALRGRIEAPRFADAVAHWLGGAATQMVRQAPDAAATAVSELLPGESFHVLDRSGEWAWGFCGHDHYVGYVQTAALATTAVTATHCISAPFALVFLRADIKSPVVARLPMLAPIAAEAVDARFLLTAHGFVHRCHAREVAAFASDPVAVAERFIGTPYKWGGRSADGIDCSGLVQVALAACGRACPRDSDQQASALGRAAASSDYARGDIVFFPGHVGMMVDAARLIHANAHHMMTVIEPLADVVERLRPVHGRPITVVKRL